MSSPSNLLHASNALSILRRAIWNSSLSLKLFRPQSFVKTPVAQVGSIIWQSAPRSSAKPNTKQPYARSDGYSYRRGHGVWEYIAILVHGGAARQSAMGAVVQLRPRGCSPSRPVRQAIEDQPESRWLPDVWDTCSPSTQWLSRVLS